MYDFLTDCELTSARRKFNGKISNRLTLNRLNEGNQDLPLHCIFNYDMENNNFKDELSLKKDAYVHVYSICSTGDDRYVENGVTDRDER